MNEFKILEENDKFYVWHLADDTQVKLIGEYDRESEAEKVRNWAEYVFEKYGAV